MEIIVEPLVKTKLCALTNPKAVKSYTCSQCGGEIKARTRYVSKIVCIDGPDRYHEIKHIKTCEPCYWSANGRH